MDEPKLEIMMNDIDNLLINSKAEDELRNLLVSAYKKGYNKGFAQGQSKPKKDTNDDNDFEERETHEYGRSLF